MFAVNPRDENSGLEEAIDEVFREMASYSSETEEYAKMVEQLSKLYSLKTIDPPRRVSPDTVAIIAGNLVGIILIVGYERANIVTSKALSFILKLR